MYADYTVSTDAGKYIVTIELDQSSGDISLHEIIGADGDINIDLENIYFMRKDGTIKSLELIAFELACAQFYDNGGDCSDD